VGEVVLSKTFLALERKRQKIEIFLPFLKTQMGKFGVEFW